MQNRPEGGFAQRPQPIIFLLIKNPDEPRDRTDVTTRVQTSSLSRECRQLRDFSFFASDLALEAVGSAHLNLRTLERTRTRVPQAVVLTPIQLQLFRVTRTVGPDRTALDVGTPADDLLYDLRGFHAPERDQDPARGTFRWTGPRASLTLPGGRDVTLVVAGGRPPGTPPSGRGASQKPQQTRGFVPLCPASQDFCPRRASIEGWGVAVPRVRVWWPAITLALRMLATRQARHRVRIVTVQSDDRDDDGSSSPPTP